MRKLSFILLFISLFASVQQTRASGGNKHIAPINRDVEQNIDKIAIKGKVTDASGEPVIGAVVQEKGKNNGTTTDVDGNFAINVSTNAVLQISLIGYVTAEVTVKNSKELSIVLDENTSQLEEVVVVGYGIQRKVNLSGAVDRVNTRDLEARPITNVSRGLQGLIPNLNIDFASGEPGKAANINIRGTSSINPTSPLILIDGVPSDAYPR